MGDGAFGASRRTRLHTGRDYAAKVGRNVSCPVEGKVTRIGQCYQDDPEYKLIEITAKGEDHTALVRVLYVEPGVVVGESVVPGQCIGWAQDIAARYGGDDGGMVNHVHLDVRLVRGVLVGPGEHPDDMVWIDPRLFMF